MSKPPAGAAFCQSTIQDALRGNLIAIRSHEACSGPIFSGLHTKQHQPRDKTLRRQVATLHGRNPWNFASAMLSCIFQYSGAGICAVDSAQFPGGAERGRQSGQELIHQIRR